MIKAGVEGLGKSDDNLVGALVKRIYAHASFAQPPGIHEGDKLAGAGVSESLCGGSIKSCTHLKEQRRVLLEEVGRFAPERLLKLFSVLAGDTVPRLRLAPVHCMYDQISVQARFS